jgi:hypothetical protein
MLPTLLLSLNVITVVKQKQCQKGLAMYGAKSKKASSKVNETSISPVLYLVLRERLKTSFSSSTGRTYVFNSVSPMVLKSI